MMIAPNVNGSPGDLSIERRRLPECPIDATIIESSISEDAMISVTPEALDRFRAMVTEQDDKALVLRLYARNVEGELRYGMSWGEPEEDDVVVEGDGVSLYVEELSVPFW